MFSLGKNFPLSGHRIIFLRFHSEKHFPYAFLGKFFSSILNKGKFTNVFLGKKILLYFGQWKILVIFWLGKFSTILNRRKFPSCFPWENFPLSKIEEISPSVFLGKKFSSILDRGKFSLCFPWEKNFPLSWDRG